MSRFRPNKKVVLSIVGVVATLALAVAAGVGLRWLQNNKAKQSQDTEFVGTPLPKVVDEAQNLRLSGDEKAGEVIQKSLDDPSTSKENRYMLYIEQGNIFSDKQDYQKAVESYQKAAALDETYEIMVLIGETWELAGDKAKAAAAYKSAIPLIPDSPMKDAYRERMEEKVRTLGGQ